MNIYIAVDNYGALGGITTINKIIHDEFSQRGHNVSFIALQNYSNKRINFEFDRLKRFTSKNKLATQHTGPLKIKLGIKKSLVPVWLLDRHTEILRFILSIPRGSIVIFSTTEIAFILTNNLIYRKVLNNRNIKLIYQFHNSFDSPYVTDKVLHIGNHVDTFITLSEYDAVCFSKLITSKVSSINNPTPPINEYSNYLSRPKRIVVASRISPEKNIINIVKAFNSISYLFPEWVLNIYGAGEDVHILKQILFEIDNPNIIYRGLVSPSGTKDILQSSRLLVMASDFEGMPMSMLEASSVGTPCLSNMSSAAVGTFIEESHGFLADSVEPDSLSVALSKAIREINYSDIRSQHSLEYAKENTIKDFFRSWIKIIENHS